MDWRSREERRLLLSSSVAFWTPGPLERPGTMDGVKSSGGKLGGLLDADPAASRPLSSITSRPLPLSEASVRMEGPELGLVIFVS